MRKLVYPLLHLVWVLGASGTLYSQNCPSILQCPNSLQTICDPTENDSTLWNEDPYTFSPLLQTADLYEGIVDLNLRALVCHNGGAVTVSYKLVLDLNSDFLGETVISSNDLPPAGIVFANNGFNPDFSGGDTLWFDKRTVPVNSKFRFALETHVVNDTLRAHVRWNTNDSPNQFLIPRLPEGQHGILWTITQDGVTKTCQYSFKVTDCAAPTLFCGNSITDDIGPDRTFPVTAAQLIDFVADNITSTQDLAISMRKAGTGTGFPTMGGQPVSSLVLDCSSLGTHDLEIWAKDQHGNSTHCNVAVTLSDSAFICTEIPRICARTYWDTTQVIEGVDTRVIWEDAQGNSMSRLLPGLPDGCNSLDSIPNTAFSISESKLNDLLNGVTTFDLLLISRHILAIEPLDAPWKIIAADANFSGSVTTNDVVQLRRLILGIISDLPGNTSWRFFTDNCDFPANPFEVTNCSTGYNYASMPFWAYPSEIRFYALKTGDVNNSALANSAQTPPSINDRSVIQVEIPDISLPAGTTIELPFQMKQAGNWSGFQCSLPFDADKIEILDMQASPQLDPQEFAFAQPTPGMLRVSWFNVRPQVLLAEESLFNLRIKTLAPVRLRDALAWSDAATAPSLSSEIYSADDQVQPLQFVFKSLENTPSKGQVFQPQPNPFTLGTSIPLRLEQEEQVEITVVSLEGKILYNSTSNLETGAHLLDIPASVFPDQGVYGWQIRIGTQVYQGKMVRL